MNGPMCQVLLVILCSHSTFSIVNFIFMSGVVSHTMPTFLHAVSEYHRIRILTGVVRALSTGIQR